MGRKDKHTDKEFIEAVEQSVTYTDIVRALGWKTGGYALKCIKKRILELNVDVARFEERKWRKGIPNGNTSRLIPLDEVLVKGRYTDSGTLRQRLIKLGIFEKKCGRCGLDKWQEEELPLNLDHIDGDYNNNLIENLRVLCPNCHSLTPTWCGRNTKNGFRNKERKRKNVRNKENN